MNPRTIGAMKPALMMTLALLGACTREVPQPPAAKPVASEVTSVASPPGPGGIAWGEPVDGLRLGIALEGATLVTHTQNVSSAPLVVFTHVATHERQSDWLTVSITDKKGGEHVIAFNDDRDKSAQATSKLPAGSEIVDRWDLAAWSARPRNGKRTFDPTFASVRATYKVIPAPTTIPTIGDKVWSGTIESGRIAQ